MAKAGILQTIETSDQIFALLSRLTQLAFGEIGPDEVKAWLKEEYPDHELEYLLDPGGDDSNRSGSNSGEDDDVYSDASGRGILGEPIRAWILGQGPLPKGCTVIEKVSRTNADTLTQMLRLKLRTVALREVVINSEAFRYMSVAEQSFILLFPDLIEGNVGLPSVSDKKA
jgi:hypothetical protein